MRARRSQCASGIHRIAREVHSRTGNRVIPSIQVNKAYLEQDLSLKEFISAIDQFLRPPSSGVVIWSWKQLEASPEKMEVLRDRFVSQ